MRKRVLIAAPFLVGAVVYGYARSSARTGTSSGDDLPTFRASREDLIESTVARGTVKPKVGAEVKVGSQLSGVVAELNVKVGDEVSRGQVLATLHSEEWRARVDLLKADLAATIAEEEYADSELRRLEGLHELVAPLQLEGARRNLKVKRAAVERARASLAQAEIQLGYTVIRAPVSGTIGAVSTYRGETVAASLAAPTFVTIVDLERMEVQAYVDETDIGKIEAGQQVTIRVDSYPGRELPGVVQAIYPKAQLLNNVVNYVVIVDITDRRGLLIRAEMTAHVTFILAQRQGVLTIPRKALLRENGQTLVVVEQSDGWVERPVKTAAQTPDRIEVVSGLREGERVVADKEAWKRRLEGARP